MLLYCVRHVIYSDITKAIYSLTYLNLISDNNCDRSTSLEQGGNRMGWDSGYCMCREHCGPVKENLTLCPLYFLWFGLHRTTPLGGRNKWKVLYPGTAKYPSSCYAQSVQCCIIQLYCTETDEDKCCNCLFVVDICCKTLHPSHHLPRQKRQLLWHSNRASFVVTSSWRSERRCL